MFGATRYFAARYFAPRYWPKDGLAESQPPSGETYISLGEGDYNTAVLLYLNDYYNVTEDDLSTVLSRYLQEGSPNDSTRQWRKLMTAITTIG